MRVGAALTDAVVAGLAAVGITQSLLATAAVGWAAFAALALLALLQVLVSGRSEALAREVAFVRSVAALGVGVLLGVAGAWAMAGLALGLAASAFVPALPRGTDAVRRGIELLLLLLALVVLFAPQLHDRAAGLTVERTGVYEGYFLWILGGVGLALLAVGGLRRREDTA
jgi:hypothetical protein